ncbi:MAG: ATP-binding protein [Coriobacteriia bacterium]|nr:ATP-binding protein [Coriobacteriia bacterium]
MEDIRDKIIEERSPGEDSMDLLWMTSFWEVFTDCTIELDSQFVITHLRRKVDSSSVLEGIVGRFFLDIIAEGDKSLVLENLELLKTGDAPYVRFPALSEFDRYHRWTLVPIFHADEFNGCQGVAIDITEQTLKEITLNWQRAVIEEGSDFVVISDINENLLYVNPGAYQMSGYESESNSFQLASLFTPEHLRLVRTEGIKAVIKNDIWVTRGELIKKDGTSIPVDQTLFSIKDEKGEIILVATVIRDITSFIEHEARLEEARSAAEAANVAKSEFLSRMSHEMRTPMNAIIGMTNIGLTSPTVEKKDYAFGKIDAASKHLLGVINDVLDMAKIEANRLELSLARFNFEQLLKRVVDVINYRVEERSQQFTLGIDKAIPRILIGDDQRLTQVITNLLSNAVKFTPEEGSIHLEARLLSEEDDKCFLEISVTDTGIGITREQSARLFHSFEQADAATSRKYGGTGLGLAISKRIVELMGGDIWIESEPGQGSKFIFTAMLSKIPDSLNGELSKEHFPEETVRSSAEAYDFSQFTILLAEDVEINCEIVLALLEPTKINTVCVDNGLQAITAFEKNPSKFDMIFMDVQMPELDGYEATRYIRSLPYPKAQQIPIIAMTANVFREDIEKCLAAGMNGHIGKPLVLNELLAVLEQNLRADK